MWGETALAQAPDHHLTDIHSSHTRHTHVLSLHDRFIVAGVPSNLSPHDSVCTKDSIAEHSYTGIPWDLLGKHTKHSI